MSAAEALKAARAAGISLRVDGDNLLLEAAAPPPTSVLDALSQHKASVVVLLRPATGGWSPENWQAYFDERATIREHDGGHSQTEAERLAFEDAVTHWLCLHPAPATDPRHGCVQCGRGDQANNILTPVLTPDGHVWVHDQCWEAWSCSRRQEAREALKQLGLEPAGSPAGPRDPHEMRRSG